MLTNTPVVKRPEEYDMNDRREHHRVIFRREVYLTLPDGETKHSMSEDFSMLGIAVFTDTPLELSQTLIVDFKVLSQEESREVNLRGKVVYTSSESGLYKSGISFY